MKNEAELMGKLYRLLQQIDENRKFRKTIDKRQIVLEQAIARAEKKNLTSPKSLS